jgi:hypothetical protein
MASRIALDEAALTIMPLVMIAQSLQFRRDRMWEVRRGGSPLRLWGVFVLALLGSVLAYFAMATGWVASLVELEHGRDSTGSDTLVICGFIASVVALTRGGTHALLLFYKERAGEIQRQLLLREHRETTPQEECAGKAAGRPEGGETADPVTEAPSSPSKPKSA